MAYRYVFSAFVMFVRMKRTMKTSRDLSCQCYYDASNQWNKNGAKRENAKVFIRKISVLMSNDLNVLDEWYR